MCFFIYLCVCALCVRAPTFTWVGVRVVVYGRAELRRSDHKPGAVGMAARGRGVYVGNGTAVFCLLNVRCKVVLKDKRQALMNTVQVCCGAVLCCNELQSAVMWRCNEL